MGKEDDRMPSWYVNCDLFSKYDLNHVLFFCFIQDSLCAKRESLVRSRLSVCQMQSFPVSLYFRYHYLQIRTSRS